MLELQLLSIASYQKSAIGGGSSAGGGGGGGGGGRGDHTPLSGLSQVGGVYVCVFVWLCFFRVYVCMCVYILCLNYVHFKDILVLHLLIVVAKHVLTVVLSFIHVIIINT